MLKRCFLFFYPKIYIRSLLSLASMKWLYLDRFRKMTIQGKESYLINEKNYEKLRNEERNARLVKLNLHKFP